MEWTSGPVAASAPATSANLGPGFDSLGLALSLRDLVTAQVQPSGLDIAVTGEGSETLSRDEGHLVVQAMRRVFSVVGEQPPGLALTCVNSIPHGFGLGSSAGAIVAGMVAARALAGAAGTAALPDATLLRLAAEVEGHPDNVAACLYGGLTIAWTAADGAQAVRLEPLPQLIPVLCVPAEPLATEAARMVLPAAVPHADAAANSARTALLITALTLDASLLLAGTEDFLHQSYRAAARPATAALIGRLRSAGLAAVVSGAGPSVLALTLAGHQPGPDDVARIAAQDDTPWRVLPLTVDLAGATAGPP